MLDPKILRESPDTVRDAIRKGLNYIPEDRRRNGLFGAASVRANVTSAVLDTLGRVFLPVFRERKLTSKYIEEFSISTTGQEQSLDDAIEGVSRVGDADDFAHARDLDRRGVGLAHG